LVVKLKLLKLIETLQDQALACIWCM